MRQMEGKRKILLTVKTLSGIISIERAPFLNGQLLRQVKRKTLTAWAQPGGQHAFGDM